MTGKGTRITSEKAYQRGFEPSRRTRGRSHNALEQVYTLGLDNSKNLGMLGAQAVRAAQLRAKTPDTTPPCEGGVLIAY
jgi:hypothetical protein